MRQFITGLALVLIFLNGCYSSHLIMGDPAVQDIQASLDVYNSQIDGYYKKIEEQLLRGSSDNQEPIASWRSAISSLEEKKAELLALLNKASIKNIRLEGEDPEKIARAYRIISTSLEPGGGHPALLVNQLYEPILVRLTDPAGGVQEFFLAKKSQQRFSVGLYGEHKLFIRTTELGTEITSSKLVGPDISYFSEGEKFSLLVVVSRK